MGVRTCYYLKMVLLTADATPMLSSCQLTRRREIISAEAMTQRAQNLRFAHSVVDQLIDLALNVAHMRELRGGAVGELDLGLVSDLWGSGGAQEKTEWQGAEERDHWEHLRGMSEAEWTDLRATFTANLPSALGIAEDVREMPSPGPSPPSADEETGDGQPTTREGDEDSPRCVPVDFEQAYWRCWCCRSVL